MESNRLAFENALPANIAGTHNIDFKLPLNTTNCNGTIEMVLTAIIYYEDCSICYVSKAYDQNFRFHFNVPWDIETMQLKHKKHDYVGHVTLIK